MDISPEQLRAFIGPRADYYLTRWARIDAGGGRAPGINWPALLLGAFWLVYRRMYRFFWIFIGVLVLAAIAEDLVLSLLKIQVAPRAVAVAITLAIAGTFGTFGTYWYQLHARRCIRALARKGELMQDQLRRAGGTSVLAPVGLLVFFLAAMVLALISVSSSP